MDTYHGLAELEAAVGQEIGPYPDRDEASGAASA